ncbi:MAG: hypothetical protein VX619_07650 [bacterium]|nr:hypothetical protein [bacterium]
MFGIITKITLFLVLSNFMVLESEESDSRKYQLFQQLYQDSHGSSYNLGTQPGSQFNAPTTLLHTFEPSPSGLNMIMGSFAPEPGRGGSVILKSSPSQGNGIDQLYTRQFFSGYRWFWMELDGQVISPIQGGFYDLSSMTLPSNSSYTYSNNVFQLNWMGPTAADYGTKVVFKESMKLESMESSKGTIVFEGNGTSAMYIHKPRPGSFIHFAFFGSYPVGSVRVDSGSGNQYIPNISGVYEAVGGVHQSSDFNKLRHLLVIAVPLIERFDKNLYKIKPSFAPDITDGEGNIIAWPKTDSHLTLYGHNWSSDTHQIVENGENIVPERIIHWSDRHIHVSLPSSLITTTEPCLDMEYHVKSKVDQGLTSNLVHTRLVNANYNYSLLCDR